ncbi:hypothetical protein SCP_0902870 [Sparassis crispa]|uniref:Uncharacterized protein n=1 Tax=Sparassis crispa TaxID=139825 RepID=A0A401GW00_9APHY|nr:hypothetical protein SCP_0902870 [Sparassis crispa]GBE86408.1 hypothetical protein SCP_0902870 [Sparassis crispa]
MWKRQTRRRRVLYHLINANPTVNQTKAAARLMEHLELTGLDWAQAETGRNPNLGVPDNGLGGTLIGWRGMQSALIWLFLRSFWQ